MSYKSYCFTIRPRIGLSKLTEEGVLKWLKKQPYAYATIEMEDEARHLHGQIWLDEPRMRGVVNKSLRLICEKTIDDWNSAQAKVLSSGTKIAYDDFYTSYLIDNEKKVDDEVSMIIDNVPDKTGDYYPSEEEQQAVQDSNNAIDKRYHRLNEEYTKWSGYEKDWTLWNVSLFIEEVMFKSKTIPVIQDARVCRQLVKCLHAYHYERMNMDHFMGEKDLEIAFGKKENEMTNSYD